MSISSPSREAGLRAPRPAYTVCHHPLRILGMRRRGDRRRWPEADRFILRFFIILKRRDCDGETVSGLDTTGAWARIQTHYLAGTTAPLTR
jgi:hypothetical protein